MVHELLPLCCEVWKSSEVWLPRTGNCAVSGIRGKQIFVPPAKWLTYGGAPHWKSREKYYLIDQLTLSLRSSNSKVDVWFIVFSTVTPLQFWVTIANGGPTLIWTCFTTHNNLVLQKFFPSRGFSHRHCLYVWVFPSLFLPYLQAWDIAYSIQSCNDYGPPLFSCPLFPEAIITPVGQTQIRVFEGTGKWFCLNLTSLRGFTPSHLP